MMQLMMGGGKIVALNTTLTIGVSSFGAGSSLRGFTSLAVAGASPTTWGSVGSATFTDSKTIVSVYDDRTLGGPYYAVVKISGFASDPGGNYLYDVTANGVTKTVGVTAVVGGVYSYSYLSGTGIWQWEHSTTGELFNFNTSGSTSLEIKIS